MWIVKAKHLQNLKLLNGYKHSRVKVQVRTHAHLMWISVAQKKICCFNVPMDIFIFMYVFQSIQLGKSLEGRKEHHHLLHSAPSPATKYFSLRQGNQRLHRLSWQICLGLMMANHKQAILCMRCPCVTTWVPASKSQSKNETTTL